MKDISMKNVSVDDRTNVVYSWLNKMIKAYKIQSQCLINDVIGEGYDYTVNCLSNSYHKAIHCGHIENLIPYVGIDDFERFDRNDLKYPVELAFCYKGYKFFSIYRWSDYIERVADIYGDIKLVGVTT